MGLRATLAWITNPYPNYYTDFKDLAGEVHLYLPVPTPNLSCKRLWKAEKTIASLLVAWLLKKRLRLFCIRDF